MIETFADKQLSALWNGKTTKIDARLHARILRRLDALDKAEHPEDLNLPGFNFHALIGHQPPRYTLHVNGPWCVTFKFRDGGAFAVRFEQYH